MNGSRHGVSQVGGGEFVLDRETVLLESHGELVLTVDGREQRWAVTFRPSTEARRVVEAEFSETE